MTQPSALVMIGLCACLLGCATTRVPQREPGDAASVQSQATGVPEQARQGRENGGGQERARSNEETHECISSQSGYSLRFPRNWRVQTERGLFGETIWGRDPSGRVSVWSSAENELAAGTPEEEEKRLGLRAVQNAPPTLGSMGSNDFKQVERGSGKIGGYPAAWCFNTFTDLETGPLGGCPRTASFSRKTI